MSVGQNPLKLSPDKPPLTKHPLILSRTNTPDKFPLYKISLITFNKSMYSICISIYVYYVCMHVYVYVSMYACNYACMHSCIYVRMHACMYVCIYICIMCVCMYVYMYVCIYRGVFVIVRGFCPGVYVRGICPGYLSVSSSSFPVQILQPLTSEFCNHN